MNKAEAARITRDLREGLNRYDGSNPPGQDPQIAYKTGFSVALGMVRKAMEENDPETVKSAVQNYIEGK